MDEQPTIIRPQEIIKQSRGSGAGVSFYKNYHRCAYYALLSGNADIDEPTSEDDPNESTIKSSNYFSAVGVCFHKLCELYYSGLYNQVVFEFDNDPPVEWLEACELFRKYREKYPFDEFTALGTEVAFRFESHPAFGVPLFTGRLDLPVLIESANLPGLRVNRAIPLLYPGAYITDFKVKWRRSSVAAKEWDYSIQMWLYMMAWDLLYPDNPCRGAIINTVYNYKYQKRDPTKGGPQFESFLIPPPNEHRREVARNWLKKAQAKREFFGHPANLEECFRFQGRVCQYHPSSGGPCNLIGE